MEQYGQSKHETHIHSAHRGTATFTNRLIAEYLNTRKTHYLKNIRTQLIKSDLILRAPNIRPTHYLVPFISKLQNSSLRKPQLGKEKPDMTTNQNICP